MRAKGYAPSRAKSSATSCRRMSRTRSRGPQDAIKAGAPCKIRDCAGILDPFIGRIIPAVHRPRVIAPGA